MHSRNQDAVGLTVIYGAGMAVAGGCLAIINELAEVDGRSMRSNVSRSFTIRQSQLEMADSCSDFDNGWFFDHFRCSKSSLDFICSLVEDHWLQTNCEINHNALFFVRERVAVTLYFLTHSVNIVSSAKMFSMSKSSAIRFIWQVIEC